MKLIVTLFLAVSIASCEKQYIQNPTCRRYLELSDKFNNEMVYTHTDTLWPAGDIHEAQIACDSDLIKLKNYIPDTSGCPTGGYQSFRYIIK